MPWKLVPGAPGWSGLGMGHPGRDRRGADKRTLRGARGPAPGSRAQGRRGGQMEDRGGLSLRGQGMARQNVLGASETLEAEGTGVMRSEARDASPARPPSDCDPRAASGTGRRPLHPGVPPSWLLGLCPCVSPWLACGGTQGTWQPRGSRRLLTARAWMGADGHLRGAGPSSGAVTWACFST